MFVKKSFILLSCVLFSLTSFANKVLDIQHWTTKNGAQVYFVQAKQIPILDIRVVFNAGSARDDKFPGIASLTNNLLNQGASDLSADEIANGFDRHGAIFSSDVSRDMSILSLRSLTQTDLLSPTLSLFAKIINHPTFPQNAFLRLQRNTISAINAQQQNPNAVANDLFFAKLYGNHPYGHPVLGTMASIKALKLTNIKAFYQHYFVGNNVTVALVGDIDLAKAHAIVDEIVGQLPPGKAAGDLPKVASLAQSEEKTYSFPSKQTQIIMGQIAIKRSDPSYFPLMVGNFILGGNPLTSRLFENVREKHGYVYTIYSYFNPLLDNGTFAIALQTQHSQTKPALNITRKTLAEFIQSGISTSELTTAKNSIVGGFPLRLDSNRAIADAIAGMGFYHLPLNYLDTYCDKIKAISREDIIHAFQHHIYPERMLTVLVGKVNDPT
ncbi:MAG: insulinase family protein [Legionellales bacterium]|nr:insulinase family protein [Legionellales bacterium]